MLDLPNPARLQLGTRRVTDISIQARWARTPRRIRMIFQSVPVLVDVVFFSDGALITAAGLVWRTGRPHAAYASILLTGLSVGPLTGVYFNPVVSMAAVLWTLGAGVRWSLPAVAGAAVLAVCAAFTETEQNPTEHRALVICIVAAFWTFLYLAAWAVGYGVRLSRAIAAARAKVTAADEVRRERARLSREIHDRALTTLSVVRLTAHAAPKDLSTDLGRVRRHLSAIESSTAESIAELRRMLNDLDRDASDADARERLDRHIEMLREQGAVVDYLADGEASEVDSGQLDLVCLIITEGLTNAMVHAGPGTVTVREHRLRDRVIIEIANGPPVPGCRSPSGTSRRGLANMRERVLEAGGSFHAARRPDGGFEIRAELSVPGGERRAP
ncbi:histidine kinase [Actinomadura sp. BRA 177]|uniref:sensor histidine kinase n=1 Tax=Actinomadura sp. BRA 177 TaxID=2745202 RepID=UPI00159598F6|nr:histidine kinase [Actinomadura sp. BRA 177]NVI88087.1 hypothetical protein [Actinomadura sp. BRA 177]